MKKALLFLAIIGISMTAVAQHRGHRPGHRFESGHRFERAGTPKAPEFLKQGDTIAILSPSSVPTDLSIIDKGAAVLHEWGFNTMEGRYARTNYHTYAGTPEERVSDIMWALRDPSIKAIVCSRGGYGSANCLNLLPLDSLKKYPKWIVGYSDITGYLSAEVRAGNMAIHGNMCGRLATTGGTDQPSLYLRDMLMGKLPRYEVPGNEFNKPGKASGILIGGNMCVYGDIAD
ncbi:MAG: LD-carboxypeptidase, partial [Muribaculaceae bacterium]|nr:LD-carboxypeptidase [Muribaculaceae bacterium]